MKNYLTSPIILLAMAASAMAIPPMTPNANGSNPTAKNHEKLIADLKLTDKEAEPVRKILAEYRKDLADWAAKNGPEMAACRAQMKKYHQMRDPKVMVAIRAAMKRLSELGKEPIDMREAMLVKLKGVLTREQYALAADALRPLQRQIDEGTREKFQMLGKMKLTKEQLDKIRAASEATMKPPTDGSPRKGNPMQLAWNKITEEILTKENHKELQALTKKAGHRKMVLGSLKNVILTPEQSTKIDVIWDKAYEDAAKNPKNKFAIYEGAQAQAKDKVLTEEQRKQLLEMEKKPHGGKMGSKIPIPMPPAHGHTKEEKK